MQTSTEEPTPTRIPDLEAATVEQLLKSDWDVAKSTGLILFLAQDPSNRADVQSLWSLITPSIRR